MVNSLTKLLLTTDNADPKVVARISKDPEQDCWEYLCDLQIELRAAEKAREKENIKQKAREWAHSIPNWKEIKRQVLVEKLKDAKQNPKKHNVPALLREFKVYTHKSDVLTPELIEKAREYPIVDLIENRRYMARCPFHPDKTASMNLKNNFYYCHGCGESGDVIDFVMKLDNVTFPEAIKKLT